jgi:hypothetical protein
MLLVPNEQFFSHIMARASYIKWDDDVVRFVFDQHAYSSIFTPLMLHDVFSASPISTQY